MEEFWNSRYRGEEFAYGAEPNQFLREQLPVLFTEPDGKKALFAAEGEGRNAVFAAKQGFDVTALDISEEGKKKALALAASRNVSTRLSYLVGNVESTSFANDEFDMLVLIYAHFPAAIKSQCHQQLSTYVKPGGIVIFEAFSKKQLQFSSVNPSSGGPKDEAMLFSIEEITNDFHSGFETIMLEEVVVTLAEVSSTVEKPQ